MILVIIAVSLILSASVAFILAPITTIIDDSRTQLISDDIAAFMAASREYQSTYSKTEFLTPEEIRDVPGYEYLRLRDHLLVQSAVTTDLSEGGISFSRIALWFSSPSDYIDRDYYLSEQENACSDGDFRTDETWCGGPYSIWSKAETRGQFSEQILGERHRMTRTIAKFYRDYSDKQEFSPTMATGSYARLDNLVGWAGGPALCAGVFSFGDVILGCEDLYNQWGNPISINKVSDQHIFLVNRTELWRGGQVIRLLEEARME